MFDRTVLNKLVLARRLLQTSSGSDRAVRCKNVQMALKVYAELLDAFNNSSDLMIKLAECNAKLGVFATTVEEKEAYKSETLAWAKKAVEVDPGNARAHGYLGLVYALDGLDYEASASEYRTAITISPRDPSLRAAAAHLHWNSPDSTVTLEESIGWMEQAVQLEPSNADYHAFLGELYNKAGRHENAAQSWGSALLRGGPMQEIYLQEIESAVGF